MFELYTYDNEDKTTRFINFKLFIFFQNTTLLLNIEEVSSIAMQMLCPEGWIQIIVVAPAKVEIDGWYNENLRED